MIIVAAGLDANDEAALAKFALAETGEEIKSGNVFLLATLNADGELVLLRLSPTGELLT